MMISPRQYIENVEDLSYGELLKERGRLLWKIRKLENFFKKDINDMSLEEVSLLFRSPSPEISYSCYLMYLSELCNLILDKFKDKSND